MAVGGGELGGGERELAWRWFRSACPFWMSEELVDLVSLQDLWVNPVQFPRTQVTHRIGRSGAKVGLEAAAG